jgi:hypothetical protein
MVLGVTRYDILLLLASAGRAIDGVRPAAGPPHWRQSTVTGHSAPTGRSFYLRMIGNHEIAAGAKWSTCMLCLLNRHL